MVACRSRRTRCWPGGPPTATSPPSRSWSCATRTGCYTLALRITLSDADAYDCVQEGLVSAWRGLHSFRFDARFSTWIHRIVVRKAYDVLERRARTAEPVDEVPAVSVDSPADARLDLLSALAALEPDFRVGGRRLRRRRALDGRGRDWCSICRPARSSRACTAPAPSWPRPCRPRPPRERRAPRRDRRTAARRGRCAVPRSDCRRDVMLRVRAEPRPRRIRQRRRLVAAARERRGRRVRAGRARVRAEPSSTCRAAGQVSGRGSSASAERAAAPLGVVAGGATAGGGVKSCRCPKASTERRIPARQDQAATEAQKLLEFRAVITDAQAAALRAARARPAGAQLTAAEGARLRSSLQRGHGSH